MDLRVTPDPIRRESPAAARNRGPILDVLKPRLPEGARVLEIASGTGQHAAWFAAHLPGVTWQPTERDPELLSSIRLWATEADAPGLLDPLALDVCAPTWPVGRFDAVFNANMIHISPWETTQGLFRGAARHLEPAGRIFLYGPFFVVGEEPAPSNVSFDVSLRERDERFGIRRLDAVADAASAQGFELLERIDLPANNMILVFAIAA